MDNLKKEFENWRKVEQEEFDKQYGDRFPTCHPDETARVVPERFHPLFIELEAEIVGPGNVLTPGVWFFPGDGEVLKLSYQ